MKKLFYACSFALFLISGCSGVESGPINLPIPFSGALTADTTVLVAEGSPLVPSDPLSITWNLFSGTGSSNGTLTYFPNTLSNLVITHAPIPVDTNDDGIADTSIDGVRREYTIEVSANLIDGTVRSSNWQCFEYPTDGKHAPDPPFDASDVAPDDLGATVEVREALCSGNNDQTGELMDGKWFLGMVKLSNGDFLFHTQESSALLIHGLSLPDESGTTSLAGLKSKSPAGLEVEPSKVVMTVVLQGGGLRLPFDENYPDGIISTPLFLPGSDEPVGTDLHAQRVLRLAAPGLFELEGDVQFLIGSSTLTIRNARTLSHVVPELNEIQREAIATKFPDDPGVTQNLLENGIVALSGIGEGQADPINCNPEAHEATGIFQDLCVEFGGLTVNFICNILVEPESRDIFTLEGVWILQRP